MVTESTLGLPEYRFHVQSWHDDLGKESMLFQELCSSQISMRHFVEQNGGGQEREFHHIPYIFVLSVDTWLENGSTDYLGISSSVSPHRFCELVGVSYGSSFLLPLLISKHILLNNVVYCLASIQQRNFYHIVCIYVPSVVSSTFDDSVGYNYPYKNAFVDLAFQTQGCNQDKSFCGFYVNPWLEKYFIDLFMFCQCKNNVGRDISGFD
jgi:hypothetical protein